LIAAKPAAAPAGAVLDSCYSFMTANSIENLSTLVEQQRNREH
jgi:hypothetical protein